MPDSPGRRVLLDENVDRLLKPLFDLDFLLTTVQEQGWAGLDNGALLHAAAPSFDVFVTMDQNLPHQQNLSVLELGVVVMRAKTNSFADVSPLMPATNEAIRTVEPGVAVFVELKGPI